MDDEEFEGGGAAELTQVMGRLERRTNRLTASANGFASAMSRAFTQAAIGGRSLDQVLRMLVLRMSSMALTMAFKPLAQGLLGGLQSAVSGAFGGGANVAAAMGAIKPFATGGVIGTPTYFPLSNGGVGLAGEAGPEAILPLARASDGRLGVAASGGGTTNVTIHIATPDVDSFRRSETWLAGQIARTVVRGQRSL